MMLTAGIFSEKYGTGDFFRDFLPLTSGFFCIIIFIYPAKRRKVKMKVTYIHHSGFLLESERFCYLFDYEKGTLPAMDGEKPVFVLSSHSHGDHYNPEVFPLLEAAGVRNIRAILSDDIEAPAGVDVLRVSPGKTYDLGCQQKLTVFRSTDLGVAFLLEDREELVYHAGDLNDWVWEEETDSYNRKMTADYRKEILLLSQYLGHREIDTAFAVLDPRQEKDYDRGMCFFLENIPVKEVYPMHYWDDASVIGRFLEDHPQYSTKIRKTE